MKDVIKMAREAGAKTSRYIWPPTFETSIDFKMGALFRFEALIRADERKKAIETQPAHLQEPVAGKGKELSEQLKLCARNVAFVATGRVDMSSAAMQEMFALIDHVCVGLDSPPAAQREWIGLTPTDFNWLEKMFGNKVSNYSIFANIVCVISAKLKERNT